MNTTNALDAIEAAANAYCRIQAGDYEKDGVLFCGKCNTPKQIVVPWPNGTIHKVGCLCSCGERERDDAERRRAEENRQREIAALRVNGIQDRGAREKTFENSWPNMQMIDKARRYVDKWPEMRDKNIGLLFWGNTGNGKTYAAAAIANALIDNGVPVLMTDFSKILNAISGIYAEDRLQYIASMNAFPLLVIDDLGAERQSEFALEIVYSVIDTRYKARLPVVITTNMTMAEMRNAKNMDYQRIYDRVLSMCVPLQFTGDSLRKSEATDKMKQARQIFED